MPKGRKPPCEKRLENPAVAPKFPTPKRMTASPPTMSMTIIETLINANQNSISPNTRAVQHDQRGQYRYPLRKGGKPVAYIHADGSQFGHPGHHPGVRALGELLLYRPVAGSFVTYADEFVGPFAGFATGWSYWFHNKENHQSPDRIPEYEPRTRVLDDLGGPQKQAHANGAADGNKLDMPSLQTARQFRLIGGL